jgi:hypothetical protein
VIGCATEIQQKRRRRDYLRRSAASGPWLKTVGLLRQTRYRGRERVAWMFTFATAAYNLVRIRKLTAAAA